MGSHRAAWMVALRWTIIAGILIAAGCAIAVTVMVGLMRVGTRDFSVPLVNGYWLTCTAPMNCEVSKHQRSSTDPYVPPHVVEIGVSGTTIYGRAEYTELALGKDSIEGYFILDTEAGTVCKGMEKEEWRRALRPLVPEAMIHVEQIGDYAGRMIAQGRAWQGEAEEDRGAADGRKGSRPVSCTTSAAGPEANTTRRE